MFYRYVIYACVLISSLLANAHAADEKRPYRILHVMSYHSSWSWNIDQLEGFKSALKGLDVEYKVIELDTKRESSLESIAEKVNKAKELISSWQPDLLYTNDDNAQKYLAQEYVNTSLPIVFSAVNRDPSEYGFLGAKNVTGVMEYEHFIPTINLLRSINKDVKRIAVIVDEGPTWKGVITRMRASLKYLPDLEVTDWIMARTLSGYKKKILELQDKVDAIALLGIFNIKDEQGNHVDYEEILKWTAENSNLPDFSYWETRVERGTLCAVTVSGHEQGYLAGQMAYRILKDGVSPDEIPMSASEKGQPMISLRRAKDLKMMPDVELLLNNTVKKTYAWDSE